MCHLDFLSLFHMNDYFHCLYFVIPAFGVFGPWLHCVLMNEWSLILVRLDQFVNNLQFPDCHYCRRISITVFILSLAFRSLRWVQYCQITPREKLARAHRLKSSQP